DVAQHPRRTAGRLGRLVDRQRIVARHQAANLTRGVSRFWTALRRSGLPADEGALEPLDRVDRRRVDPAQDREVERDEIAEQHERDESLQARLAAALDAE